MKRKKRFYLSVVFQKSNNEYEERTIAYQTLKKAKRQAKLFETFPFIKNVSLVIITSCVYKNQIPNNTNVTYSTDILK